MAVAAIWASACPVTKIWEVIGYSREQRSRISMPVHSGIRWSERITETGTLASTRKASSELDTATTSNPARLSVRSMARQMATSSSTTRITGFMAPLQAAFRVQNEEENWNVRMLGNG